MSPGFWCNTTMVWSQCGTFIFILFYFFQINVSKILRYNVGEVMYFFFLADFRHLSAITYLCIVADNVHPFMTTTHVSSNNYFQQNKAQSHKAQINLDSWTWQWVLKCHQISLSRAPLRSSTAVDSHYDDCVMLICQYGQKSQQGSVLRALLNLCHEEFWP